MKKEINITVFSKDRPMQLEACMRSLQKHFKEWPTANLSVIYLATNKDFNRGYEILKKDYSDFTFSREHNDFRTLLLEGVNNADNLGNPYTMFLVDDIIFKDDFSLNDDAFKMLKNNEQMLALSLRLHPKASYCYAIDNNMAAPKFIRHVKDKFRVWQYRGCEGDWGYGLSVDGNVYNTSFISWLLNQVNFSNPNNLEAALNSPQVNAGVRPLYMCCYDGISKLLNVPANRVQDTFKNRNEESVDAVELNNKFLAGKRIKLDNVTGINNFSVHYPIDYEFTE
jgi:hypothetical protein